MEEIARVVVERIPDDTLPDDESNPGVGWHFVFSEENRGRGFRFTIRDEAAMDFGAKKLDALSVLRAVVQRGRYAENLAANREPASGNL